MDRFYVLRDEKTVVEKFISEDAALAWITSRLIDFPDDPYTYRIAQLIATNKAVRVWNRP